MLGPGRRSANQTNSYQLDGNAGEEGAGSKLGADGSNLVIEPPVF